MVATNGNGKNGTFIGVKVILLLCTALAGIASGLGAWNLAHTTGNALDVRELKTRQDAQADNIQELRREIRELKHEMRELRGGR
jgi:cell division protein FtsB